MMESDDLITLDRARSNCVNAGRLLDVVGYRPGGGLLPFDSSSPEYHDLLDPDAEDSHRLHAARVLLERLKLHVAQERLRAEASAAAILGSNPYGRRWKTTAHGAALETALQWLASVDSVMSEVGVVPVSRGKTFHSVPRRRQV